MKYKFKKIESIEKRKYNGVVHDLTVKDNESYNIDRTIVHNSICVTRDKTAHGFPALSTVKNICEYRSVYFPNIGVIADGGVKKPADAIKYLAFGADLVMMGSAFSHCSEAVGEIIELHGKKYRTYRGNASYAYQKDQGKEKPRVEGESFLVEVNTTFDEVITDYTHGLQSALSYTGANNLKEFKEKVQYIFVTPTTVKENGAHGKE